MQKIEQYKYRNKWKDNLKYCVVMVSLVSTLIFTSLPTRAGEMYAWKPPGGIITMDVVKNDGVKGGGTWLCKSLRDCYTKVLEAEERGATQYCETITIKRDGHIVWHRNYNEPYWNQLQRLNGHGWYR